MDRASRIVPLLIVLALTSRLAAQPVVINEIHYNPAGSGDLEEFIELHNPGAASVNVSGWQITDGIVYTIPASTSIPAGGYLVLTKDTAALQAATGFSGALQWTSGSLDNAGERVALSNAASVLIDEVVYDDAGAWTSVPDGNGPSLELISPNLDNNAAASWAASIGNNGTPGAQNSVFVNTPVLAARIPAPQTSVPTLASVSATFDRVVTGVTAASLTVNGSAATSVSGSDAGPYVFSGFTAPTPGSASIVFSGAGIHDLLNAPFGGASWTCSVGQFIVINEINYHPHDTLHPAQETEFIELVNHGAAAVNMGNWTISNGVVFTFPGGTTLNPGAFLVIAVNAAGLQAATGYSGALQWTSGNLSNSGESVAISDNVGNVIDTVTYSDSGAWPSSPDGGGPTLELINPGLPNQFASAWRPSSATNGTPGAQNSDYNPSTAPLIISPMHTPSIPAPSVPVIVTATVLDDGVSPPTVSLHYRQDFVAPAAYTTIPMVDDGAHDDGGAGDGLFGASMPGLANGEQYDFYITADDGVAVSTYPTGHPSALPTCSPTGCLENPACIPCQTLLCKFSNETLPTDFPVYHIVVAKATKATQEALICNLNLTGDDPCKTEFDATFVDNLNKVYYNVTERYRGQSSIVLQPRSYRVDFPSNNKLQTPLGFPVRKLTLNGNAPVRQKFGFDLFGAAGLPTSRCSFARVRYTGVNYDTTFIGNNGFTGLYAAIETVDNDFLDSQDGDVVPDRGLTSDGNLYRGENTGNLDWRGTDPAPYRVNAWGHNGYSKENNEELDDFTDLINLCNVMNNSLPADYATAMAAVVDEDEWCKYFAMHMILANREGGIYRDTGDDYFLYFNPPGHANGFDAKMITWDTDSILRDGNETIWRTGNVNNTLASVRNFLRHNAFAPIFVKAIRDLLDNELSPANFNARMDATSNAAFFTSGGSNLVPITRQQFKDWYASRVAFINNEIISQLTVNGVPASPYVAASPTLALSGTLNQAGTHAVTVNDVPATFSVYAGTWSSPFTLQRGLNTITVRSLDRNGDEMQSITHHVYYQPAPLQLMVTAPRRMVDSKTITLKAEILDIDGRIDWRSCTQLGTVTAQSLYDTSPVPITTTVFETMSGGAGGGAQPANSIRFYNGVGSVSLTLDVGADFAAGDIRITVTAGSLSGFVDVTVLDGEMPGVFRELSGTLTGAGLTWSPADGVIHLTDDVIVDSGNTLTILPGTLVMVDSGSPNDGVAILAQNGGSISADASQGDPIFFFATAGPAAMALPQAVPNNDPSWRGIYLDGSGSSVYRNVYFTGAGNGIVVSHPRPPIIRVGDSHDVTIESCVMADCPGMGFAALPGSSGSYAIRDSLFSRVGIGGEWLGSGYTLAVEDSWFTRIGRAPVENNVDGDALHLDGGGNTINVRRCVLTDIGDDFIDHSTGAEPTIEDSLLYDARDKCVSLDASPGGSITMTNCLLFNSPGGIRCNNKAAILTHCTLGHNNQLLNPSCADSVIDRCVLWPISHPTCCGNVNHTIVGSAGDLGCGAGNSSQDPLFVQPDPAGCNYDLGFGSPAATAGPSSDRIGWLGFTSVRRGARLTGQLAAAGAVPDSTVSLDAFVQDARNLRGYQTVIAITRTSGAGSLTVDCPGSVSVNEGRSDYVFFGLGGSSPSSNCAAKLAASSLAVGAVHVGSTPKYLATYNLHVSSDATEGATFEVRVLSYNTSTLTHLGGGPIAFDTGPAAVLTIGLCPSVDAGLSQTICANGAASVLGSATHTSGTTWSSAGDGDFADAAQLGTTYTPGSADITAGSVVLTLTAAPNSPCTTPLGDTLTLTIQRLPIANAGSDQTICSGSSAVLAGATSHSPSRLWSTAGDGSFNDATLLAPTYTPGPNDLLAGSVELSLTANPIAPCATTHADTMTLTFASGPTADAGDPQTICVGSTAALSGTSTHSNSRLWTTAGDGHFANAALLATTYTPGPTDYANGSVLLTLTAHAIAPCSTPVPDTVLLTFAPQPLADAGEDQTICASGTATLAGITTHSASLLWSTAGDGGFDDTAAPGAIYTPGSADIAAGTVTLTLTANPNAPCTQPSADDVVITIQPTPIADAGIDRTICTGSTVTLSGTRQFSSASLWTTAGDGSFDDASLLSAVYTPGTNDLAAGSVELTLTADAVSPCTLASQNAMTITILPGAGPNVAAGSDLLICPGDPANLVGTASNTTGTHWTSGGDGWFYDAGALETTYTPGPNDLIAGTITLMLTADPVAPCTVASSDTLVVTIQPLPISDAGVDQSLCNGSPVLVAGSSQHASGCTWTSEGDGSFETPGNLSTRYNPGSADLAAGSVVLKLTCDAESPCTSTDDDTLSITWTPGSANGDMDADGFTNGKDVQRFVDAVLRESFDAADVCPGDFTLNGFVTVDDVPGMVHRLLGIP